MAINTNCTRCLSWEQFSQARERSCNYRKLFGFLILMALSGAAGILAIQSEDVTLFVYIIVLAMGAGASAVGFFSHLSIACYLSPDWSGDVSVLHLHRHEEIEQGKDFSPCLIWTNPEGRAAITVAQRPQSTPMLRLKFGFFPGAKLYGEAAKHWAVILQGDYLEFRDTAGFCFRICYVLPGTQGTDKPGLDEDRLLQTLLILRTFENVSGALARVLVDRDLLPHPQLKPVASGA